MKKTEQNFRGISSLTVASVAKTDENRNSKKSIFDCNTRRTHVILSLFCVITILFSCCFSGCNSTNNKGTASKEEQTSQSQSGQSNDSQTDKPDDSQTESSGDSSSENESVDNSVIDNDGNDAFKNYFQETSFDYIMELGSKNIHKLDGFGVQINTEYFMNYNTDFGVGEADWALFEKRVKEIKVPKFRINIMPDYYEPVNDDNDPNHINWEGFDFESEHMKALYKILDVAQKNNVKVNITTYGAEKDTWLGYPSVEDNAWWLTPPTDLEEYAESTAAVLKYLIDIKGYTCIYQYTPFNEPDFGFTMGTALGTNRVDFELYVDFCEAIHNRLKKEGLRDKIDFNLADDATNPEWLKKVTNNSVLKKIGDSFNSHVYKFDSITSDNAMLTYLSELTGYTADKPFQILEFGSGHCIDWPLTTQTDLDTYARGIKKYAALSFVFNVNIDECELIKSYSIRVSGQCKDSRFCEEQRLWNTGAKYRIGVENPYLWYPIGRGEQDMYDITVELIKNGAVVDTYSTRLGIRSVELLRTSVTDKEGNGEFCFIINEERVFVTGTNWVPLDAFHSQDVKRLDKALEMMTDLNCNMVRCWGGNVYEDHAFFDYCDEHGIMVWQDFSMACAIYPQDDAFAQIIYNEAEQVIKKLRQHPSLTLWAGDNECDLVYSDWEFHKDPNQNRLTRKVLPQALADHDPLRPYLPSSPYIDEYAFAHGGSINLPENHMWGARSYYKSSFYSNALAHFASEQGYPGSPSPESLKKFLSPEKIWPYQTDEWIIHGASPESTPDVEYGNTTPFYFRTGVMAKEIGELFGDIPNELVPFSVASQIVQAEAVKFFIETYRIGKWRKTGIMWWNLLDGWPQISDAVVDYYFCHKQAYYAIKMSQQPVCIMFGEMGDWGMSLYGVNDTKSACQVRYCVKDLFADGAVVLEGTTTISADSSEAINFLPFSAAKQAFFLIEWEIEGVTHRNYYLAGTPKFEINRTVRAFINSGLFQAEGYDDNLLDYFSV